AFTNHYDTDTSAPIVDWSFTSNHAPIAGAAAAAIVLTWYRMAFPAALIAVMEAFSRVFVGAHYPHDVTAGLLLGATVAVLVSLALSRPLTAVVDRLAEFERLRPLLRADHPSGEDVGVPHGSHPGNCSPTRSFHAPCAGDRPGARGLCQGGDGMFPVWFFREESDEAS